MGVASLTSAEMQSATRAGEGIAPAEMFDRLLLRNRDICSNCFRRTHTRREHSTAEREPATQMGTAYPQSLAVEEQQACEEPLAETRATPPERQVCSCGAVDTLVFDRDTLGKEQALASAGRISRRLAEQGIAHSRRLLLATVQEAKSNPSTAGRDREIFATAVEHAIRNTSCGSTPSTDGS